MIHLTYPPARGSIRAIGDSLGHEPDPAESLLPVAAGVGRQTSCCELLHGGLTPSEAREVRDSYVCVYSGPEPPSGGVKRPPFAVMAPHCTQLDGATLTVTVPSPPSVPTS